MHVNNTINLYADDPFFSCVNIKCCEQSGNSESRLLCINPYSTCVSLNEAHKPQVLQFLNYNYKDYGYFVLIFVSK